MDRQVFWTPWDEPGLEHVRITQSSNVQVDGLIIGMEDDQLFRLHYTLRCDLAWRTHELRVQLLGRPELDLHLVSDGNGSWTDGIGNPLPKLQGCLDVDLTATPFTNTLPIRRLNINPGEAVEIVVAYVNIPTMIVEAALQRYTCLIQHANGALYKFESIESGFTAELPTDAAGLVLDYPELFRRVWSH